MNTKKYFLLGLFVIIGFILLILGCIIFGGSERFAKKLLFETYFETSIQGLDAGSPVKFRGVRIGSVESVHFTGNEYGKEDAGTFQRSLTFIRVLCSIDAKHYPQFTEERLNLMIKRGLRVKLESQALTGISHINLDFFTAEKIAESPVLEFVWLPHNTYIPVLPSTMQSLLSVVDNLSRSLDSIDIPKTVTAFTDLVTSLNTICIEANIPELSKNANALLTSFSDQTEKFSQLLERMNTQKFGEHLVEVAENLSSVSSTLKDSLPPLVQSADGAMDDIRSLVTTLNTLAQAIKTEDLNETFESLNRMSAQLEVLIRNLRERPSRLIFDDKTVED